LSMPATKEEKGSIVSDRGAYKLRDACEYLGGLSPVTVRRFIDRGLIRRHPAVRHILIAKTELDRFLATHQKDVF